VKKAWNHKKVEHAVFQGYTRRSPRCEQRRDEMERGWGALEEKRLLAGGYRFGELDGLTADERNVLLDSAALLFIEHNISKAAGFQ
jgi:hypothetical protein